MENKLNHANWNRTLFLLYFFVFLVSLFYPGIFSFETLLKINCVSVEDHKQHIKTVIQNCYTVCCKKEGGRIKYISIGFKARGG